MNMNTDWKQHLLDLGANVIDDVVQNFGEPERELSAALDQGGVADLSSFGLITVTGKDALPFLQGQLTNDVGKIAPDRSEPAAWCSAKGRIQVLLRVFAHANGYGLILPREQLPETLTRLSMYRLRAKVEIRDESQSLGVIGLLGAGFESLLKDRFSELPSAGNAAIDNGAATLITLPGPKRRYLLILPAAARAQWWSALSDLGLAIGEPAFLLAEVLAAQPRVLAGNIDEFIPQMLNLERIGAVSFTKGCYTGQEIVARTQYLGRIKRRMYLCRIDQPPPLAGVELECVHAPQTKGRIVMAAPHPDGGCVALAVLPVDQAQSADWHTVGGGLGRMELLPLPYALSDDG